MSLTLWKGNRLPLLSSTITADNQPFNLAGGTVTFSMRAANSGILKVSAGSATITDAAAGQVSYAWGTTDTDVIGDFAAWWTYNAGGKSQDTPEFTITIEEHSAPEVSAWVNPVSADGSTKIFQGDAYLAAKNTALIYYLSLQDMPNLTGGTVTWKINGQGSAITATILDPSTVSVDLTSAQTAAFSTGNWTFGLTANMGGSNISSILRSNITVSGSLT